MNHRFSGLITVILIFTILNSSSFVLSSQDTTPKMDTDQSFATSIPYVENTNVTIDGIITQDEYAQFYQEIITGIRIHWEYNNDSLTIGMIAEATGWVAIGFGDGMDESNMIMAGVLDNGTAYAYDLYGIPTWTHDDDVNQGGNDNVLDFAGVENSTHTVIEFVFEIDETDTLDPEIPYNGTMGFFVGYHDSSDDKTAIHSTHSSVLDLFFKPVLTSMNTILTITGPTQIDEGQEFSITISLKDTTNTSLEGIPIFVYRITQFGELLAAETMTASNGSASSSLIFEGLNGNVTLVARSQEVQLNGISYLSSENTLLINVHGEPAPEPPAYVIWSRTGLLIGFWGIGIVIWSIFGYNIYAIIQIYRHRNDAEQNEIEESK